MCVEQIECDTAVGKWYKMLGSDTLNAYELQIASLFIRSESIRNTRISLNRLHFKLESFGVRPKRRIRMVKIVSTSRVLVAFFVCAHRHCRRCRCLFIFFFLLVCHCWLSCTLLFSAYGQQNRPHLYSLNKVHKTLIRLVTFAHASVFAVSLNAL